ncbi:MAG: sugar ABC transporter permease [Corynebacterium sp.]|uniref:carbohydrate ABC transporter permease n=1 Tax=Corynebacterium sp. TaxID=1720 RepID=UPI0026DF0101|nr:sugar ABC transporter permease [Corynebacterium sp.]MDO5670193.1 sugar ABC transporter permease [Corynebacterium sp.]
MLPVIIVFLLFQYYPLLRTLIMSMQGTNIFGQPTGFVGFENFRLMFTDPRFLRELFITLVYTVGSVVGKIVVGLAIAIPLSARLKGTVFLRSFVLIPMAMSVAATAVAFRSILQPVSGPLDRFLAFVGIDQPPRWLTDETWALFSVTTVEVWFSIGYVTLLLLAALDGVPDDVMEAGSMDGASELRKMWSIQLPLISPTIFFLIITLTIFALRQFAIISVLTGGGPGGATTTLVIGIYNSAFGTGTADYGASAARGVILMLIVLVITAIQFRFIERRVHYS